SAPCEYVYDVCSGVAHHRVAQRTDVVGYDERFVPYESRRVTGVIEHRGEKPAARIGDAREQHRVVRSYRGMKTADELADGGVKEITVGCEVATPHAVDNVGGHQPGQRFVHQLRRAFA